MVKDTNLEGELKEEKDSPCPVRQVLSRATGKWHILIMLVLMDGPQRFNALRRLIGDVTQRVLTENLRSLERDGYLTRDVNPGPPVAVSYALTPLGEELARELRSLAGWAKRNLPSVEAAREAFDRRG